MDLLQHEQVADEPQSEGASNVTLLFPAGPVRRRVEPRASADELAEYRRLKPQLLRMLAEWQIAKGPQGCPVLSQILSD